MEEIDLMNMLRHAFLFGVNEGPGFDSDERDETLKSLLEDLKRQGGESYNEYCGSHCEENCRSLKAILDGSSCKS